MLNYTGVDYLKIDIANHFGLDKLLFELRIKWVDSNEDKLESQTHRADDPFRYAAAVLAYRATQQGIPTGHMVGLDACASGIQVMSAITGDLTGAYNTGLTGKSRQDVYTIVTDKMNFYLEAANGWLRSVVKPAVMTFFYGSKQKPKDAFGEGTVELSAFYAAVREVAPGAYDLMATLLATWRPFAHEHSWTMPDLFKVRNKVTSMRDTKIEVDELNHTTFLYRHEVNDGTEDGLANAANVVHSIDGFVNRELCGRCNYDGVKLRIVKALVEQELWTRLNEPQVYTPIIQEMWEKHEFISIAGTEYINPNSLGYYSRDYLEALLDLIKDTLDYQPFEVVTVHDEFKAHASNMNRVRKVYVEIFAELAESNILNAILTELTGDEHKLPKYSNYLGDEIRKGNYALS